MLVSGSSLAAKGLIFFEAWSLLLRHGETWHLKAACHRPCFFLLVNWGVQGLVNEKDGCFLDLKDASWIENVPTWTPSLFKYRIFMMFCILQCCTHWVYNKRFRHTFNSMQGKRNTPSAPNVSHPFHPKSLSSHCFGVSGSHQSQALWRRP